MLALASEHNLPVYLEIVLDSTALAIIILPAAYLFYYRQLQRSYIEVQEAHKRQKIADIVFNESSEAIMVSDNNNRIIQVNPAFTEITGYTLEELKGKNPHVLSSGKHDKAFYLALWKTLCETGRWSEEI